MKSRKLILVAAVVCALAVLALLVVACGGGGTSSTTAAAAGGTSALGSDAKTYTHSSLGYSFQYPAAWKIEDSATTDATAGGSSTSGVGAYDPKGAQADNEYIDIMVVSTYKLNLTVTDSMIPDLKSEIENLLSQLTAQGTDVKTTSPLATTEKAGLKGYEVSYTFTKGGTPTTSTLYFLFKGNMEYQVTMQAATADWEKELPILSAMVAGFKAP
jgi:hypothetical protein